MPARQVDPARLEGEALANGLIGYSSLLPNCSTVESRRLVQDTFE
jgi:hypothetical protein